MQHALHPPIAGLSANLECHRSLYYRLHPIALRPPWWCTHLPLAVATQDGRQRASDHKHRLNACTTDGSARGGNPNIVLVTSHADLISDTKEEENRLRGQTSSSALQTHEPSRPLVSTRCRNQVLRAVAAVRTGPCCRRATRAPTKPRSMGP
jgi:hypothetical protein